MVKVPSIEADIRMKSVDGVVITLSAGYATHLVVPPSSERLEVKVLDALSVRKSHEVHPGDDAFVVFLLTGFPETSYQALRTGCEFHIVDGDRVVGAGVVQARVD